MGKKAKKVKHFSRILAFIRICVAFIFKRKQTKPFRFRRAVNLCLM